MRLIKKASGKTTIKMSKVEWQRIGKQAGWFSDDETQRPFVERALDDMAHKGYDMLTGGKAKEALSQIKTMFDQFKNKCDKFQSSQEIDQMTFDKLAQEFLSIVKRWNELDEIHDLSSYSPASSREAKFIEDWANFRRFATSQGLRDSWREGKI